MNAQTAALQAPLISQVASINVDGFTIPVKIKDVRSVWGRTDCLVTPVNGAGEKWVSRDRLKINQSSR